MLLALPTPPPNPPKIVSAKLSPAQVLERFFTTDRVSADWFTPDFLQAVPIAQIEAIITQLKQELGAWESVLPEPEGFTLKFKQGTVPAQIVLTSDGKISGLFFSPSRQKVASLTAAIDQFKALPGKVSVLVMEGKTHIFPRRWLCLQTFSSGRAAIPNCGEKTDLANDRPPPNAIQKSPIGQTANLA
jgi:hypothetical protein